MHLVLEAADAQYRLTVPTLMPKCAAVAACDASFVSRQLATTEASSRTGRPMEVLPCWVLPVAASDSRAACLPASVRSLMRCF